MARKNIQKIALGLGALAVAASTSGQTFRDVGTKSTTYSIPKTEESTTQHRLNLGAGYYPSTDSEGFLEASYQFGNKNFFIGPYLKIRNESVSTNTKNDEFKTHIINEMYAVTDQITKTQNYESRPIEAGLKLSQGLGPLELSLNAGLTQTERWAKKAIYGYDKIIDNAIEVRSEEFKLPVEISEKSKSIDFIGSGEIFFKPFNFLGIGVGVDTSGKKYVSGIITFGGKRR